MMATVAVHFNSPRWLTERQRKVRPVKAFPNLAALSRRESSKGLIAGSGIPNWVIRSAESIEEMLTLEPNWDLDGAPSIDETAIKRAFESLSLVMSDRSSPPQWTPTPLGGVQLDWHESGVDLEIAFEPSSEDGYVLFADHSGGQSRWDETFSSSLPRLVSLFADRLIR